MFSLPPKKNLLWGLIRIPSAGWPHTLVNRENRENGEKNSLQGKIREFEILLNIREKSGNLKKSYLCKVKIFRFYSCSDVATGGFFLPYA